MPSDTPLSQENIDFFALSVKCVRAASLWRTIAEQFNQQPDQKNRLCKIASLFEQQSSVFSNLHRYRLVWKSVKKSDASKVMS